MLRTLIGFFAIKKNAIAEYRRDFERGLSGTWFSELSGGEGMVHGTEIEFNTDGTGKITHWNHMFGVGDTGEDQTKEVFHWEPVGKRCIRVIKTNDEESIVSYDFKARKNEYGRLLVLLYEPNHWAREHCEEEGFWESAYPLVKSTA
jgi:hypothetical protein